MTHKKKATTALTVLFVLLIFSTVSSVMATGAAAEVSNAKLRITGSLVCAIFDAEVVGAKGHNIQFSAYPTYSDLNKGIENVSGNPELTTKKGFVISWKAGNPSYDDSAFTAVTLCVDSNEFPLTHFDAEYYFHIEVYDSSIDELLATYDYSKTITDPGDGDKAVRISYLTVDTNIRQGGKLGVLVSFSLNTLGYQDVKSLKVSLYMDNSSGNSLVSYTKESRYTAADGSIGTSTDVDPDGNEYAIWNGEKRIELFVPVSVFPPASASGYYAYPFVVVYSGTKTVEYSYTTLGADDFAIHLTLS